VSDVAEVAAASAELASKMREAGNLGDLEAAREQALAAQLGLEVERRSRARAKHSRA
jgi:hypothetical protein